LAILSLVDELNLIHLRQSFGNNLHLEWVVVCHQDAKLARSWVSFSLLDIWYQVWSWLM